MFIHADIQPELSVPSSYNATERERGRERAMDNPRVNLSFCGWAMLITTPSQGSEGEHEPRHATLSFAQPSFRAYSMA